MSTCKDCEFWDSRHSYRLDWALFCECTCVKIQPYSRTREEVMSFNKTLEANDFFNDDVEQSGCSILYTGEKFGCSKFTPRNGEQE